MQGVAEELNTAGLRVDVDDRSERMNAKIRDVQNQKIPYMLVIGDREVEKGTVSVRLRSEEYLGAMSIKDFFKHAQQEIESRV